MRKGVIAQWILSRLCTPEQAESAVGDCLEQAETRGSFWFWHTIARLVVSFAVHRPRGAGRSWGWAGKFVDRLADNLVLWASIWLLIDKGWRGYLLIIVVNAGYIAIRAQFGRFSRNRARTHPD